MRRALLCVLLLSPLAACANTEGDADNPSKEGKAAQESEVQAAEREPEDDAAPAKAAEAGEDEGPPPGVKTKGNLPVKTESELAEEDAAREACVSDCVEGKQAEARAPEDIEADCRAGCMKEHPIEQVEVQPDSPM
jgi:hypothetical protein